MNVIRWIIAFPAAVAVWLFFPPFCEFLLPSRLKLLMDVGTYGFSFLLSCVCFLVPILSLGTLVVLLPPMSRSNSVACVVVYSIICMAGTLLVSFVFAIGGGPNPLLYLLCETLGTIVGGWSAYAYVSGKTSFVDNLDLAENDDRKAPISLPWILRWIFAYPLSLVVWEVVSGIFGVLYFWATGLPAHGFSSALMCFVTPIASMRFLAFILPPGDRRGLLTAVAIFPFLCILTTSGVAIGLPRGPVEDLSKLVGLIGGTAWSCACVLAKSSLKALS